MEKFMGCQNNNRPFEENVTEVHLKPGEFLDKSLRGRVR